MNKAQLVGYFEAMDRELLAPSTILVYGSAAFILLDEPDRISLDIDVAGPYSDVDLGDFRRVALAAGVPINPADDFQGDHIEWIGKLRLCLSPPDSHSEMVLWQGSKLTVKTVSASDLIASKLIRYDEIDQSDIQYLLFQSDAIFETIAKAVDRLPAPFKDDALVRENLNILRSDMEIWKNATS